jgi:hypothetical protein
VRRTAPVASPASDNFESLYERFKGFAYKGDIQRVYVDEYSTDTKEMGEEKAMAAADLDVKTDTELQRIERWRAEELERAGYDRKQAAELAARHDVDLHVAVDLLRQGCSPDLALSILL